MQRLSKALCTPENSEGEWVSVSEYAGIMGISTPRVYQKIKEQKLYALDTAELASMYPDVYRKVGRGKSGACSMLVWLSEDDGI